MGQKVPITSMHPGEMMDSTADMDIMDETSDALSVAAPEQLGSERLPLTPRGYQLEMLEASMKQNIIVAVCPTAPQLNCGADLQEFRWIQGVGRLICTSR